MITNDQAARLVLRGFFEHEAEWRDRVGVADFQRGIAQREAPLGDQAAYPRAYYADDDDRQSRLASLREDMDWWRRALGDWYERVLACWQDKL